MQKNVTASRNDTPALHCGRCFFCPRGQSEPIERPCAHQAGTKADQKKPEKERECLKSLVVNQKILRKSPRKRKRVFKQPGGQPNVSVSLSQGSQGHPLLSTHRSITLGLFSNKPGNIRELCPTQRLINFFVQIFPQCAPRLSDKPLKASCKAAIGKRV